MRDELTTRIQIEESLLGSYRSRLWDPFVHAVERYRLIEPGDRIAVCISGGKDSMLMAKLIEAYQRETQHSFTAVYMIMDPGYNAANRQKVESNAKLLGIPYELFESDIFEVANAQDRNPCFLCARMRRGYLYDRARELGCQKIALGHHLNDVIETTVMAMFYGSQLQAMPPRLSAKNFPGMELIRPLYMIREEDIIAWAREHGLSFIQCACRFTEKNADEHEGSSKRKEVKELLRRLREEYPQVEEHVFQSLHSLQLETLPGWKAGGEEHSFTEHAPMRLCGHADAD